MTTPDFFNEIWRNGNYRLGSTAQRLVSLLTHYIPQGSVVNDYGSGTGRAEVKLLDHDYMINMVDFASDALEPEARALIGERLTYTVSPLESLTADFPIADWGICINVLMTVDPTKLNQILNEIRRTCRNLIVEVYDWDDVRLGVNLTTIKGGPEYWLNALTQVWNNVEFVKSPEHSRRYIFICRGAVN